MEMSNIMQSLGLRGLARHTPVGSLKGDRIASAWLHAGLCSARHYSLGSVYYGLPSLELVGPDVFLSLDALERHGGVDIHKDL
jgi:hypothetical protein